MAYGTVNADIIQSSVSGVSLGAGNSSIMKNRIINGAMVIDQRNSGASVTPVNTQYLVDRFQAILTAASKYTVQQNAGSVTPPVGFVNYLGVTSSSAYSIGAGDIFGINQFIEGYNIADLGWGTANAKTVNLSFWVRSSLTGTFGGSLNNAGDLRSYPFSYTISSANTWEQKSITIVGDTSGTWATNNGAGMRVLFGLGVGSTYSNTANTWASGAYYSPTGATSVVGTNGATFYITGVQLEVGSSATGFEYRQYQQELALCQRYYQYLATSQYLPALCFSTNRVLSGIFATGSTMRTTPTAIAASNAFIFFTAGAAQTSSAITLAPNSSGCISLDVGVTATTGVAGAGAMGAIALSAEL